MSRLTNDASRKEKPEKKFLMSSKRKKFRGTKQYSGF